MKTAYRTMLLDEMLETESVPFLCGNGVCNMNKIRILLADGHILMRLGASNRADAVAYAIRENLLKS